eukprot:2171216-Prymnesium_polylepis.1
MWPYPAASRAICGGQPPAIRGLPGMIAAPVATAEHPLDPKQMEPLTSHCSAGAAAPSCGAQHRDAQPGRCRAG